MSADLLGGLLALVGLVLAPVGVVIALDVMHVVSSDD